jgi:hypothetical protein
MIGKVWCYDETEEEISAVYKLHIRSDSAASKMYSYTINRQLQALHRILHARYAHASKLGLGMGPGS